MTASAPRLSLTCRSAHQLLYRTFPGQHRTANLNERAAGAATAVVNEVSKQIAPGTGFAGYQCRCRLKCQCLRLLPRRLNDRTLALRLLGNRQHTAATGGCSNRFGLLLDCRLHRAQQLRQ